MKDKFELKDFKYDGTSLKVTLVYSDKPISIYTINYRTHRPADIKDFLSTITEEISKNIKSDMDNSFEVKDVLMQLLNK